MLVAGPEIFRDEEKKCYKKSCEKDCDFGSECRYCFIDAKKSAYSRKCFMTGEYCSKQTSIQRERKDLHEKDEINAFVIMSFSDMADVIYEQRIKRFIRKLKSYLAFDKKRDRICCSKEKMEEEKYDPNDTSKIISDIKYRRVKEIHVERGDTDVASNYVMCSRICQRIQIADIIIVDVSHQNPNVFYELGMAIALGKLILPICFSESFYKMSVPETIKKTDKAFSMIEHHIGCYPWRKDLFEYYGIFQTQSENAFKDNSDDRKAYYMEFEKAKDVRFEFLDSQYNYFPYDAEVWKGDKNEDGRIEFKRVGKVGEKLYDELKESYNNATKEDNTLLVYTMDDFLNQEEAGRCIVNYYHTITAKLQESLSFCGERIGVLVQGNAIVEEDKDSGEPIDLFYSIGDIIHLGVNQASYLSEEKKLKTDDVILSRNVKTWKEGDKNSGKITEKQRDEILRAVKGYVRNRGMIIHPNNPVYVKRELDRFKYAEAEKILDDMNILKKVTKSSKSKICYCTSSKIKCLYHKTLQALRYVNEVVVDISDNSVQALFWLGVAHGSSVNAIIVTHQPTEAEHKKVAGKKARKIRTVFDVAGLWTAILHSNDTNGFYRQLELAQYGIINHEKLMLKSKREKEIERKLESYYRSRFWNAMLRHNQLLICMPQIDEPQKPEDEPRGFTSKWDFRASALLSHYLSKRTVISEYRVEAVDEKYPVNDIGNNNFISLGSGAKPLGETLSQYILNSKKYDGIIHEHYKDSFACENSRGEKLRVYKGFEQIYLENKSIEHKGSGFYTQHPHFNCANKLISCKGGAMCEQKELETEISELEAGSCCLYETNEHSEIAQLIMWRDSSDNFHEKTVFRVAINGSSGPATLALASILVGDDQKIELFHAENEKNKFKYERNLLSQLQKDIRNVFMECYKKELAEKIEEILKSDDKGDDEKYKPEQRERYRELVWYAVSTYFYNELYRYFLPLLSDKDRYSLYNGMYNFLNQMRMDKESPFDVNYPPNGDIRYETAIKDKHVIQIIETIPDVLWSLLAGFQGLEVFFKVTVKHDLIQKNSRDQECKDENTQAEKKLKEEKKEDTRDILDIVFLKDSLDCFGISTE